MYPPRAGRLCFGADYNPEQWPADVWREDMALMRDGRRHHGDRRRLQLGVPRAEPGRYEFDWLDEVMDLLRGDGIAVDLATATASPPPWFSQRTRDSLPVDRDGRRALLRQPAGLLPQLTGVPAGRPRARRPARPALPRPPRPGHVARQQRVRLSQPPLLLRGAAQPRSGSWLQDRYEMDLAALNTAWGTAFWSQRYSDWAQVLPPRATPSFANPGQELDFRAVLLGRAPRALPAERDVLHERTPGVPVTTNFMAGIFNGLDYWRWAPELDVVSTDHYLTAAADGQLPRPRLRGRPHPLARGRRAWLLMEHSTSAVNWQPRNAAKAPGRDDPQ